MIWAIMPHQLITWPHLCMTSPFAVRYWLWNSPSYGEVSWHTLSFFDTCCGLGEQDGSVWVVSRNALPLLKFPPPNLLYLPSAPHLSCRPAAPDRGYATTQRTNLPPSSNPWDKPETPAKIHGWENLSSVSCRVTSLPSANTAMTWIRASSLLIPPASSPGKMLQHFFLFWEIFYVSNGSWCDDFVIVGLFPKTFLISEIWQNTREKHQKHSRLY